MAVGDRLFYGLSHGVGRAGDGQASKLAVMIRIRVKPGGRDEWRSQWGEHLRTRAEANLAQELYLVVDDAADADVVHLFELYGDSAEMQRNAAAEWFAEGGPAAGRAASGGDGNAGVGEGAPDMSSGLTPCRGAAGQAGLGEDGMDVVLHGRQRDGQGPGDLLDSSCLRIPGRRPGVRGRSAW
jgi:quinol monooxygenase YgiN